MLQLGPRFVSLEGPRGNGNGADVPPYRKKSDDAKRAKLSKKVGAIAFDAKAPKIGFVGISSLSCDWWMGATHDT